MLKIVKKTKVSAIFRGGVEKVVYIGSQFALKPTETSNLVRLKGTTKFGKKVVVNIVPEELIAVHMQESWVIAFGKSE